MEGHWPPFTNPALPTAVQHLRVAMAIVVQHPPEACRIRANPVVVRHHRGVVGDAKQTHEIRERLAAHDMHTAFGLLDPDVDREADCSGDMRALIPIEGGAVDYTYLWIVTMRPQPVWLGEQFGMCIPLMCAHNSLLVLV